MFGEALPTKKKVLIFIDWFSPGYKAGGPARSCLNLVDHLKSDFEFSVATRDRDLTETNPYPGIPSDMWTVSPNGVRTIYLSHSNLKMRTVKQLLLNEAFDVLYLNSLFSFYFTILPLLVWKKLGKRFPVILAPRGMLFEEALREKWLKKKAFLFFAKALYRDVIWHATSEEEGAAIRNAFGEEARILTAPNLASRSSASYISKEKKPGTLWLVYCSRIHPHKNLRSVFEYLKEVDQNQSIQFDIFGPIESLSYWKDCEKAIRTLPPHIVVRYGGDIKSSKIYITLRDYHFMILPTLGESFGHAIVEALSAGCPVIISDRTPWRNLASVKAGWDIPLWESEQFAQAIRYGASMDQSEYDLWSKGAFDYAQRISNDMAVVEQSKRLFHKIPTKILLINQAFYPDVMATAQYLTDLAVALAQRGEEVNVLASRRGYASPYPVYQARETYRGVKVTRVCAFSFGRKSKLTRILDACLINLAFGWHLLRQARFDRVVAMTNPPLVAWFGFLFAQLRRSEFIYWMMDVNPDQAIEAGWIRENSWTARFFEAILRIILKGSDKIIVLDQYMKERLLRKGVEAAKVKVLPLWALPESLLEAEPVVNAFRNEHGLNGKFVVMYSGNLSLCHPLDTVLEAAARLQDDASTVFVFVGGGERLPEVLEFKKRHRLRNLICLPYEDRSRLGHSLRAADLHVVTMGKPYVGILHPSKIYGILAAGHPFAFIGPKESFIGDLIRREQVGYQIEQGDVEGFIRVIRQVKNLDSQEGKSKSLSLSQKESSQEMIESILQEMIAV